MSPANDAARRIAALSPEQREMLLRELAQVKQDAPPEQPPTPVAAPPAELPPLVPRPKELYLPFPLTDVQEMYWSGRSRCFDLWTPGGNVYIEYELPGDEWFVDRLEQAMRRLCDRHQILRFVMRPDGQGQYLESLPPLRFELVSLRGLEPQEVEERIAAVRERFRYHEGPAGTWPLFGFLAHFLDGGRVRLQVWLDCLLVDGLSRDNLWRDLIRIMEDPDAELAPLEITYRDYAETWREIRQGEVWRRAEEYWRRRIPRLPPPLDLPLAEPVSQRTPTRWKDQFAPVLDAEPWQRVKDRAARLGVTPTAVLISAFVETLRAWNRRPEFFFSLEGTYWPPVHPQLREMVGNFNTIYILAADDLAGTFADRTRRLQEQLSEVLEHRVFSGFRVLREIRRHLGGGTRALSPVMFNSLVEFRHASYQGNPLTEQGAPAPAPDAAGAAGAPGPHAAPAPGAGPALQNAGPMRQFEETAYMPQLLMLPAVFEGGKGQLAIKFQTVEHLLPAGLLADLRDAFLGLMKRLADSDTAWKATSFGLAPATQLHLRANPAGVPASPAETLWSLFAARAAAAPERPAIADSGRTLTYGELAGRAEALARRLQALGAGPNQIVAAVLERGWQQAVTVLGILRSGAACLPLDSSSPVERLAEISRRGVRLAVARGEVGARLAWPEGLRWVSSEAEAGGDEPPASGRPPAPEPGPRDLAWAGPAALAGNAAAWALLEHRAVVPALLDLGQRLGLGAADRLLSLSPPGSDLALIELLGPLAVGASVVLPAADDGDAASWARLAETSEATVWSAPPALLARVLDREASPAGPAPRLVLLVRDAVPVTLPDRLRARAPQARVVGLAGLPEIAVAAAIHEIGEVPPEAVRIPAGRPIARQTLHVLDHALEARPDWVPGELYVGGPGLARGYLRDEPANRSRFLVHPRTGERLFRTGLLARFLPGGELEIWGREQEVIAEALGYSADLRRTEAALERQPGVSAAAVRAWEQPGRKRPRLVAYVVPERGALGTDEIAARLAQSLPWYLVPDEIRALDELPLDAAGAVDRSALPVGELVSPLPAEGRAMGEGPGVRGPSDPLEEELARLWCEVLEIESAGVDESFFALGGTSFKAVRVLARLQERIRDAGDLSSFLYEPTILHLAGLLRPRLGPRPEVPMLVGEARSVSLWKRVTGWLRRDPDKEN